MKDLAIIYTVDDAFIKQAAVSIESVIQNNPNKTIRFYLCTDKDENTDNFKKLKNFYKDKTNVSFKHLNATLYDDVFDKHKMDKWGSNSFYVYWRLVAFDLIDEEEAIYLDADTLVLQELTFPKLDNKIVGCVIDVVHPHYQDILDLPRDIKLYNTGTMFVDVKKWKSEKCTKRMIDSLEIRDKYLLADQDIFSLVLQDETLTISPKYNYFAGYDYYGVDNSYEINGLNKKAFYRKEEIAEAQKDVVIYHCLDGVFKRPWINGNEHPAKEIFQKYMRDSAWHDITYDKDLSGIFVIEKKMEFLPQKIYNKVHNFALWLSFEIRKNKVN